MLSELWTLPSSSFCLFLAKKELVTKEFLCTYKRLIKDKIKFDEDKFDNRKLFDWLKNLKGPFINCFEYRFDIYQH